jgi:hypothetical protein
VVRFDIGSLDGYPIVIGLWKVMVMDNVNKIKLFMEKRVETDGYDAVDLAVETMTEFNIGGNNVPVELLQLARKILRNPKKDLVNG